MENLKIEIEKYLNANIIDLLEMNNWLEKDKAVYLKKIVDAATYSTMAELLNKIKDEDVEEFNIAVSESPEKAMEFIESKIPDYKEIMAAKVFEIKKSLAQDLEIYKKIQTE